MKIYDISQEVFSCQVYPDDPTPEKKIIKSMKKGEVYNLTGFNMCAHNGTHIDAPFHFISAGARILPTSVGGGMNGDVSSVFCFSISVHPLNH